MSSKAMKGLCFSLLVCFALFAPAVGVAEKEAEKAFTLDEAYRIALDNNEQIQVSKERLEQAKQDIDVATAELYPQISAQGSWNRQKKTTLGTLSNPDEYGLFTIKADQHLYQWGKVWSGRQIAEHFFRSSSFRHERRLQEILFQVSSRYYEVLLGRRSIEIAKSALTRAQRQLERARGRFEVGVVTRTDVLRAQVQVAQAQEQLERARNQYDVALENLALEIGLDEVPGEIKEPPAKDFGSESMSSLIDRALDRRRDLKQARKEVEASQQRVEFEKADYFPRFSMQGEYTRTNEEKLFYGEDEDWNVALKVSYPLFTGGRDVAEIDQARSKWRQARVSLKRLKREIRTEVRSVYLDIQTQKKVIQQLKEQVDTARRNYEQVTAQFEEGVASSVDQVDAFTSLNEAENRLAQAHFSYQLDLIRLQLATGTFQTELLNRQGMDR